MAATLAKLRLGKVWLGTKQALIFSGSFQRSEEETEWGHEVATHQGGAAQALATPPTCETASVHS
jgi:hypothetical protein